MNDSNDLNEHITFQCLDNGTIYVTIENELNISYYIKTVNLHHTFQYQKNQHNLYDYLKNCIVDKKFSYYFDDRNYQNLFINFHLFKKNIIQFDRYDKPISDISINEQPKYIHYLRWVIRGLNENIKIDKAITYDGTY